MRSFIVLVRSDIFSPAFLKCILLHQNYYSTIFAENLLFFIERRNARDKMNMKEVLKSIGGKIVYKNNYYELINGNIIKTHDRKFDILLPILNKNSNNNFTIACNLGHIFLHMGYRTNFSLWNNIVVNKQYKFKSLKQERQAEYFALSLLMPKTIFLKVFYKYSNNNMIDMTEMANYFKVSINSARTRTYMLNLIDSSCLK